jgi:6-pyruvoyltetrahydropterin/6-carboxytetrahydropterin synthase
MFTVTKDFRFEAAHSLPHLPKGHKCRRPHGHSYRIRLECTGPLDKRGFVVDYAEIAAAVNPVIARLDHHDLNKILRVPTTAENLAEWIFRHICEQLPDLRRVVVFETDTTSVIYDPLFP